MACGEAFDDAVRLVREHAQLGVGLHLVLDDERPLLPSDRIRTLVDGSGYFLPRNVLLKRLLMGKISAAEIYDEFNAQFARLRDVGIFPTHVDGHGHVHVYPRVARIARAVCQKWGVKKIRWPQEPFSLLGVSPRPSSFAIKCIVSSFCVLARSEYAQRGFVFPRHFRGMMYGGALDRRRFASLLSSLPVDGVVEIMTHPALVKADEMNRYSLWNYDWSAELDAMLMYSKAELRNDKHLDLIHYGQLDV